MNIEDRAGGQESGAAPIRRGDSRRGGGRPNHRDNSRLEQENLDYDETDGIKVLWPEGWVHVRVEYGVDDPRHR